MRTFRVEYRDEDQESTVVTYWTEDEVYDGLKLTLNKPIISFTLAVTEVVQERYWED